MKHITKSIVVALSSVFFLACGGKKEPETKAAVPAAKTYPTMKLQPTKISGVLRLPGGLQPFEFVQIYPKISGFVKSVYVDRGSLVKQGQTLIQLEAPEIEQQLAAARQKYSQAEALYANSRDKYQRLLETSKTPGTISAFDLAAAAARMHADSAMAQGELAAFKAVEATKNYLSVSAPFAGVITERNVHPGALAGPGAQNAKPMLVLQQISRLRLVVEVPEQYAAQVKDGDKVHYTINALPGQDFTGIVSRSSGSLSSSYRAETIEIDVENPKNLFKSGMYAEVKLPTSGNDNAWVVPKSAIVSTTERKYVVSVVYNVAKWTDITEGNQGADSTEIFGDFHPGDEILTQPDYQIKNGQAVR